jgi:hypothetical protein
VAAKASVTSPDWTAADQAELDLLVFEVVGAIHRHRDGCETCQAGWPPCPRVTGVIEAVIEWRDLRVLVTRANRLRAGQDLIDLAGMFGYTPEHVRRLHEKWRAEDAELERAAA